MLSSREAFADCSHDRCRRRRAEYGRTHRHTPAAHGSEIPHILRRDATDREMRLIWEAFHERAQVCRSAGSAIGLDRAGKHSANAAIVSARCDRCTRFAQIMGADAHQQPSPGNPAHIVNCQVILPKMHTICLGEQRDIWPIIDDQRRSPTSDVSQHSRPAQQLRIVMRLLSQLDAVGASSNGLLSQCIPRMVRAQRFSQKQADAPLLPATSRESYTELPFYFISTIAQLFDRDGDTSIDDFGILFNRSQRFTQALASRLHNFTN